MSRLPIEYGGDQRTVIIGGRLYAAENINLRAIGCPDWLATKIETREAQRAARKGIGSDQAARLAKIDAEYANRLAPTTEALCQKAERLAAEIARG